MLEGTDAPQRDTSPTRRRNTCDDSNPGIIRRIIRREADPPPGSMPSTTQFQIPVTFFSGGCGVGFRCYIPPVVPLFPSATTGTPGRGDLPIVAPPHSVCDRHLRLHRRERELAQSDDRRRRTTEVRRVPLDYSGPPIAAEDWCRYTPGDSVHRQRPGDRDRNCRGGPPITALSAPEQRSSSSPKRMTGVIARLGWSNTDDARKWETGRHVRPIGKGGIGFLPIRAVDGAARPGVSVATCCSSRYRR